MASLAGKSIALVATDGFEQSELEVPLARLKEAGARVDVVSLKSGEIKGWDKTDWGRTVPVDRTIDGAKADDYDAVVFPGGVMNPDKLRVEPTVVEFAKAFWQAGKVVAAVCHGPWVLVEAGIVKGQNVTSYKSIKTDVVNAGGKWADKEVVVDQGLVTSRQPSDLEAFCKAIVSEMGEARHTRRAA